MKNMRYFNFGFYFSKCMLFTFIAAIIPFSISISQNITKEFYFGRYLFSESINQISKSDFKTNAINDFCFETILMNSKSLLRNQSSAAVNIIDSIVVKSIYGSKDIIRITYDESQRISFYETESYYDDHKEPAWLINFTYDSCGRKIFYLSEAWNGHDWEFVDNQSFTYDAAGNLTEILTQFWTGNNWENIHRSTYTYGSKGNYINSLSEDWDGNQWINSHRLTYAYYPNGKLASSMIEFWSIDHWEMDRTTLFEYSPEWKLLNIILQRWDGFVWNNLAKMTYLYSGQGNRTTEIYQQWDNVDWLIRERSIIDYNNDGYFVNGTYEYLENGKWIPGDGVIWFDNPDGFDLHYIAQEMTVYYKNLTDVEKGNINAVDFSLSQNYPNPFNPTTKIQYTIPVVKTGHAPSLHVTLKIFDILGREIKTLVNEYKSHGTYEVKFNGTGLPSGVYFYQLQTDSGINMTRKMILTK